MKRILSVLLVSGSISLIAFHGYSQEKTVSVDLPPVEASNNTVSVQNLNIKFPANADPSVGASILTGLPVPAPRTVDALGAGVLRDDLAIRRAFMGVALPQPLAPRTHLEIDVPASQTDSSRPSAIEQLLHWNENCHATVSENLAESESRSLLGPPEIRYAERLEDLETFLPALGCQGCHKKTELHEAIKKQFQAAVSLYGPLRMVTYSKHRSFSAIDLRPQPAWVDYIPNLQNHEKALIHKILERTQDILVLEPGSEKTPDLIVDGTITEMKSAPNLTILTGQVNYANEQVGEFSRAHGGGIGDLAIDWWDANPITIDAVRDLLNQWIRATGSVAALRRIWVYRGSDLKIFELQHDRRYQLLETIQGAKSDGRAILEKAQEKQRWTSEKLLETQRFERKQAKEEKEARQTLRKIRKLARYNMKLACFFWKRFCESHQEAIIRMIEPDVLRLLSPSAVR